jgi:DNA invertase Pin-like site-specific DNA recombinase
MPDHAAIYVRSADAETQGAFLRDAAKNLGYTVVRKYVDSGAGATVARDQLMRDVRKGEVAAVLVACLSSFSTTSHLLRALEEFRKYQVDFISLNESLDTATAAGKMVVTILGAIVEMDRGNHREAIRMGIEGARREGKRLGRPPVILDIEVVQRLRSEGCSLRTIAARLKCSAGVVQRILANFSPQPGSAADPPPGSKCHANTCCRIPFGLQL